MDITSIWYNIEHSATANPPANKKCCFSLKILKLQRFYENIFDRGLAPTPAHQNFIPPPLSASSAIDCVFKTTTRTYNTKKNYCSGIQFIQQ